MIAQMDEILRLAEADPDVLGVLLIGSRAYGVADERSDWDVVLVLADGAVERDWASAGVELILA